MDAVVPLVALQRGCPSCRLHVSEALVKSSMKRRLSEALRLQRRQAFPGHLVGSGSESESESGLGAERETHCHQRHVAKGQE